VCRVRSGARDALEPVSPRRSGSADRRSVGSVRPPDRPGDTAFERLEPAPRINPVQHDSEPAAIQPLTPYREPGNARLLPDHPARAAEPVATGRQAMTGDRFLEVPPVDGGLPPPPVAPVTIEVSIDRIEVRGTPPPASQRNEPQSPRGLMTLDEYLRRRSRGGVP
jgi:hypothetical protein